MPHRIRVDDLYQDLQPKLQLILHAGQDGLQRTLLDDNLKRGSYTVAGPLNFIHPNRVQLIGRAEYDYLYSPERDRPRAFEHLFNVHTRVVLLVDGIQPNNEFELWADETDTVLFSSPVADALALEHLQHFAALHLSEHTTLHGVFLEVMGMGVLLTGEPGVGKSELALELISRGNRLIADDAPHFARIAPDTISGESPPMLREFLEVRGLGVLNIREMFGDSAIKNQKYLRLIVHLEAMTEAEIKTMPRLSQSQEHQEVLGVAIPHVTIPVAPGRNLAIVVEAAVRNHLLKLKGVDATQMFIERQQQALLNPED